MTSKIDEIKELKLLKIVLLVLGVLFILALIIPIGTALAYEEGVISGQVVNKTKGGAAAKGPEVTLTNYANEKLAAERKVTADDTGKFEFTGLSLDASITYLLTTRFQEALYSSDKINLQAENPLRTVDLIVYDSTNSDENIQASNGHFIVFADNGNLQVMEVWRFNNSGDKTYIGIQDDKVRSTLKFTLPQGATSVDTGRGFIAGEANTGTVYTTAIPPGITDISFSYMIPYQGRDVTISRKTDYPVVNFGLLVQDTGVKVRSSALIQQRSLNMSGTKYLYFTAQNLSRNVDLDASFSGVTIASAVVSGPFSTWPWLTAGSVALGLLILVAYPRLWKKRVLEYVPPARLQSQLASRMSDEKKALIREVANLDDEYEAGRILESEYRTRRTKAKARLLEIYTNQQANGKQ